MTTPLLTKSDGTKFGKTEGGAVWLSPEKTSVYRFYQFLIQVEDAQVIQLLKLFTFLPMEDIDALALQHQATPERRDAQKKLALELTKLVHGETATADAIRASEILFGGSLEGITEVQFGEVISEVPNVTLSRSVLGQPTGALIEILIAAGLSPSKGQVRKDIEAGGINVNNVRVSDTKLVLGAEHLLFGKFVLLRKGRRITRWCGLRGSFQNSVILSLSHTRVAGSVRHLLDKRNRMKSLSLAFVLALGLVFVGCHGNPFHKMYSATAEIELNLAWTPALNTADRAFDPALFSAEVKDMLSDANLMPVLQQLKLDRIWAKRLQSDHDTLSPQEALDHLRNVLKIENPRRTDIVEITAYSEIPQEAADIANAITDSYKTRREQEVAAHNKRDLDDPKNKDHLKQLAVDQELQESPVRIISRAEAPPE